jgi:hypothetical protein
MSALLRKQRLKPQVPSFFFGLPPTVLDTTWSIKDKICGSICEASKRGPVDKPNPDPNGCKDDKGREALKEFIVARCDAP